jgi:hypothetical protein
MVGMAVAGGATLALGMPHLIYFLKMRRVTLSLLYPYTRTYTVVDHFFTCIPYIFIIFSNTSFSFSCLCLFLLKFLNRRSIYCVKQGLDQDSLSRDPDPGFLLNPNPDLDPG